MKTPIALPLMACLMLAAAINCNQTVPEPLSAVTPIPEEFDVEAHIAKYEKLKKKIPQYRGLFIGKESREETKNFFFHLMVDSIWPYWYGTEWDFNGITETPRKGMIACGYFVSTTLRDAGVELNRYKIAQQAASVIVEKLCATSSKKTFTKIASLESYLEKQGDDQLYILGLDNHVGFIIRENGVNYFVHADYTRDRIARREQLSESPPVIHSNILVIGNVLDNGTLMNNWAN